MAKTRLPGSAVRWTSPTGRSWTSLSQHPAPQPAVRPLPALQPVPKSAWAAEHSLSPQALAELIAQLDTDPRAVELRTIDVDPDEPDRDPLADRLDGDIRWTLDLDDPHLWAA